MEKNNTCLFITAHKDYVPPVSNPAYKVIASPGVRVDGVLDVYHCKGKYTKLEKTLGEVGKIIEASETFKELPEYVGLFHYRRLPWFMDNIPDMDVLFQEHDVFVPKWVLTEGNTLRTQFDALHNKEDLDECLKFVKRQYPSFNFEAFLGVNFILYGNISIMRRELFVEWVSSTKSVIDYYLETHNITNDDEMLEYVKKNWTKYDKNGATPEYQQRALSFVIERLTMLWLLNKVKSLGIIRINE